MIKEILGVVFILVLIFFSIKFARRKINQNKPEKDFDYEKEFEDGNVLLPIDKRDFENFKEFEKKSKKVSSISNKLKTIDEDFKKLEFIGLEEEANAK